MHDSNSTTLSGGQVIWLAIRPKTLPASMSPVILGTLMVPLEHIKPLLALLAFACALLLQITVNLCNDFFDAKSGIDTQHRLGPTRVTQAGLMSSRAMKTAIALCAAAALCCGLMLALLSDYRLIYVGVFCLAAAFAYSGGPAPLASHAMGEVAVLIFFGWVAVIGSYYVHTTTINSQIFLLANALGFILAAIMLVNNIRDIDTDKAAGKNTLAVCLGETRSQFLFTALIYACGVLHVLAFSLAGAQHWGLALIPLLAYLPLATSVVKQLYAAQAHAYNVVLARTSSLGLWYSLLTGLGFLLSQRIA